jgi:hypothetical protein
METAPLPARNHIHRRTKMRFFQSYHPEKTLSTREKAVRKPEGGDPGLPGGMIFLEKTGGEWSEHGHGGQ